jgi:hypothetical protein
MTDRRREELEIVFQLNSDTEETQIGEISLGLAVNLHGFSSIDALQSIVNSMCQFGMVTEFIQYQPKPVHYSAERYLNRIKKGKHFTPVQAGGLEFSFGKVPVHNHSFLSIKEVKAGSAVSWEAWLAPYFGVDGFIQARVVDVDYDYWQNAKDPLEYQVEGRSYSHLPMKSNGLPPPVEQMEIDISNNPGRWVIRSDYREAIGSTMWLSPLFWQKTGTDNKEAELIANGFEVQHLENDIIKVIAAESCFCDETTESVQRKLRSVLFP